jgi:uncharacterized protein (TIGR03086 family)
MTQISERYGKLADAFANKIAKVSPDAWSNQSPCAEWKARDVVRHVVDTQGMFLGFIGEKLGDIPSVDDDPAGAFKAASTQVRANLEDPAKAKAEYEGFMGKSTFEGGVDKFLSTDLVVHGWDLAKATGQDDTIDPDEIPRVQKVAESFGDALRSPGAFGPAVDAPAGADAQTKLIAFLGRTP